jgi:hypothetical protein
MREQQRLWRANLFHLRDRKRDSRVRGGGDLNEQRLLPPKRGEAPACGWVVLNQKKIFELQNANPRLLAKPGIHIAAPSGADFAH